jgi:hypothetical protein
MTRSISLRRAAAAAMFSFAVLAFGAVASACPFCAAETRSLSEELDLSDAAVLAKLVSVDAADPDSGNAKFKVIEVLAGDDVLAETREIETVFFGEPDTNQVFLITGIGIDYTQWATPLPLSPAGIDYLGRITELPAAGADRLAFFQNYLQHEDPLLAQDAYEEFARADYADVKALSPRMYHDRLVTWIKDTEINPTRRRLYLTMLGVCGTSADLPMLEEMITSGYDQKQPLIEPLVYGGLAMGGPLELPTWTEFIKLDERRKKLGLDALVGCYLVLRGPDGLNLIEERLLRPKNVEYSYVYSTIMALRFLGEETNVVPRERLLSAVRLLLDNPDFADQVIPDLSRWEDWSVMERLVDMFKSSDKNGYIRSPVVAYLLAAAEQPVPVGPRAMAALAELERLDGEVVKRARSMAAFGFLARAKPTESAAAPAESDAESAADVGETESGKLATPPDPAGFGQQLASAEPEQPTEAVEVKTETAAPATSASPAAAPEAVSPELESAASPLLVIGLPLGAVVLLAGLFWLILRNGAV